MTEHIVVLTDGAVAIPDGMAFEETATRPCAGVTAWPALFERRPVQPGETVPLLGTGGLSILALQRSMGVLTGFADRIDTGATLEKRIALQGSDVGSVATLRALSRVKFAPRIHREFPFEDADAADDGLRATSSPRAPVIDAEGESIGQDRVTWPRGRSADDIRLPPTGCEDVEDTPSRRLQSTDAAHAGGGCRDVDGLWAAAGCCVRLDG